jgi:hypothetical protein
MKALVSPEATEANTLHVGGMTRASNWRGSQPGRCAGASRRLGPDTGRAAAYLDGK